ncbi:MAG: TauD/TfdA family dioxygenase [Gammaproteobacteria bacterium]|nr:TauD/TfdA family dioxygenase [Gammaproteobacteria bacterium]
MQMTSFSLTSDQLTIQWQDGNTSNLNAMWLRDHCQLPCCKDAHSGQRLLNITDIPFDLTLDSAKRHGNHTLDLVFSNQQHNYTHQSSYDLKWLRQHCYHLNTASDDRSEASKTLWLGNHFKQSNEVSYPQLIKNSKLKYEALRLFSKYGFTRFVQVPIAEKSLLSVIQQFGFPRVTNYGELFEVKTAINANNLAFTNLGLGCHTDNPYRDPVPSVQLLHCLSNSADGGDSILIDGFMAAAILRDEQPELFKCLCETHIQYRFSDSSTDLRSRVPMIEVNDRQEICKVRFNNRSIAPIKLAPEKMRLFYNAYRAFAEILQLEHLQLSYKMNPGDLVMFDNTRIMHARKAFGSDGDRHLQGAYADLDGLYSCMYNLAPTHNQGR